MANINASIVKKLQEKIIFHLGEAARYGELVTEFGGKAPSKGQAVAGAKRGPKPGSKRTLSPEHIEKMQAARRAKKEQAKPNGSEGANLAAAAGE